MLKDPLAWEEVLLKFNSLGADASVQEIVQTGLTSHELDWRSRLVLAEMAMGQGDAETAQRRLWEILDMPVEPSPPQAPPPPAATPQPVFWNAYGYGGYSGYSALNARVQRAFFYRQNLAQLSARNRRGGRYPNFRWSSYGGSMGQQSKTPNTLAEARDAAVIYLAAVAEQQGQEQAFLDKLEKKLSNASRKERILTFGMLDARESLTREIALEAAQPSGDTELDQYCLGWTLNFATQEGQASQVDPKELAAIDTFLQRIKTPSLRIAEQSRYHMLLIQTGGKERAEQIAKEILGQADTVKDPSVAQIIFQFAIQKQAFDVAEKIVSQLAALGEQPGQAVLKLEVGSFQIQLGSALLQKKESATRGVQLLAAALRQSYAAHLPGVTGWYPRGGRQGFRFNGQTPPVFPYPNRYLDEQRIQMWMQLFGQIKGAGALEELKTELNRQIQTLPEDQTVYAQLARACFWWWDDAPESKGDAIREVRQLAKELKDDDLQTMVATMLAQAGEFTAALSALEEVSATTGDQAIDKQLMMAEVAIAAKDRERAKTVVMGLTKQRLDAERQGALINLMQKLGMQEEVQRQYKQLSTSNSRGQRNTPENQLSQRVEAKDAAGAVALARSILARDPLAAMSQGNEGGRHMALQALETFKELAAYQAELEKQLAETPSSVRTVYLLAEATGRKDSQKAVEYYRKLVELKPTDAKFQARLASLLRSNKQPEEAMRIWETILARDPETLFMNNFSEVMETFKEAKETSRLGEALLKLPKQAGSNSTLAQYGGFSNRYAYFSEVADALQREKKLKEAIALWRVALENSDSRAYGSTVEIVQRLASALTEVGDTAGVKAAVEAYLFPKVRTKAIFGSDPGVSSRNWMQVSISGDGVTRLPALGILRMARQAGVLDELRAEAVAATKRDDDRNSLLLLLIDTARRDGATLPDFAARLRATAQRAKEQTNYMTMQLVLGLALELREWPEARHLALETMVLSQDGAGVAMGGNLNSGLALQIAELALQLGEQEVAQKALRSLQTATRQELAAVQYSDYRTHLRAMDLMLRASMVEEAESLLKVAKANSRFQNDEGAKQEMDAFENRLRLLSGQGGNARVMAWTPAPLSNVATTVYWEIGSAAPKSRGDNSQDRAISVNGEDLPLLDGQYDLELYHGPSTAALHKIATVPAAKSRGAWRSDVALDAGYLLAIARGKSKVLFGQPVYIPTGPNLLANPDFQADTPAVPKATGGTNPTPLGWTGLSAGLIQVQKGGTRSDGSYADFAPANAVRQQLVISQRIPIEAGKKYLLSGWQHVAANQGNMQIEGFFFDKDGKQVGHSYGNSRDSDRWFRIERWLVPANERRNGQQSIPSNATEFEIRIQVYGSGQLDDLYFGLVPSDAPAGTDAEE
jgi:hypothetical protein